MKHNKRLKEIELTFRSEQIHKNERQKEKYSIRKGKLVKAYA
jgi:hypothetical protein